jgi:hypothetical protein
MHVGVQHPVNRAVSGDVQQPAALLLGELAVELQLTLDVIQLSGPVMAVQEPRAARSRS